jgi:site-specific DNA recombinase
VVWVFNDSFSWWDIDRPWINQLFLFIDQQEKKWNKIHYFVVDDINRIARSYEVHLQITTELKKRNIAYETVNMKFESTPVGSFMEWMMALNAEFFRIENRARVISRQEARLLDWYRPWCYPIGYKTDKAPVWWRMLIRDEPNATIIQEALEWYASWSLSTALEVAYYLEDKWLNMDKYDKKRKKPKQIHRSLAHRIMTNVLYAWYIEYNAVTRDKKWLIKKAWNISLRKWKHEWLISLETFDIIQKKLNTKRPYQKEALQVNDEYPLRRYIVCDCCGLPLTSGKSRSGTWARYPYYTSNKNCELHCKNIPAPYLHQLVSSTLEKMAPTKQWIKILQESLIEEYQERMKEKNNESINTDKQLKDIDAEINKFMDVIINSSSSLVIKKMEQKIEECEYKKLTLQSKATTTKKAYSAEQTLEYALDIISNAHYIFKEWTIDEKQTILELAFGKTMRLDLLERTLPNSRKTSIYQAFQLADSQKVKKLEMMGFEPMSRSHTKDSVPL